jgi:hypothetical protein
MKATKRSTAPAEAGTSTMAPKGMMELARLAGYTD